MKPYALLSDQHCHAWSAFSTVLPSGLNSRLQIILDEMQRAADELKAVGGDTMVFAGDLFHQRGSIDPEVFNPVFDAIERITHRDIKIIAIPGNHDLKGQDATSLGNAMQKLDAVLGVEVLTHPTVFEETGVLMVPWIQKLDRLKAELLALAEAHDKAGTIAKTDLVLHAGINGVITGLPDHGLEAPWLTRLGFRRVFAGHYHAHKIMEAGRVVSIGATTQQTWSDVGTKAGFLIVEPDRFSYRAARAPNFVDLTGETDEAEIPLIVDGNYVRVRGMKLTDLQVKEMRESLAAMNAKGVSFQVAREVVSARTGTTSSKTVTLDESVETYIDAQGYPDPATIKSGAADILASVRSVTV